MLAYSLARVGRRPLRRSFATARTVYLNGQYLPKHEAKISVLDRGFMFSDSVYEVTSVLGGKLVDFEGHVLRLQRSLKELGHTYEPDMEEFLQIHRTLTKLNNLEEGIVYVQVTRGVAVDRSFTVGDVTLSPTVMAMTQSMNLVDNPMAEKGIRVKTVPDLRWKRCDIKTTQLLYQSLAKQQALDAGVDDAWMVEPNGLVTEGSSNNAWIITKDNILLTRPCGNDILSGITRATVMRLLNEKLSLQFQEGAFTVLEAQDAAEAFSTSSSAFVMPVIELDGEQIGDGTPGPLTRRLRQIYIEESHQFAI